MEKKDSNILKLSISGFSEDNWNRLQDSLTSIIDKISKKLEDSTNINIKTLDFSTSIVKDITSIATQWAKAKVEKPTLLNEKIKAEIAEKFAQTKKILKDAEKADEEIKSLRIENRHKELSYYLDELEKVFKLMQLFKNAQITFSRDCPNPSLFVGDYINNYEISDDKKHGITSGNKT